MKILKYYSIINIDGVTIKKGFYANSAFSFLKSIILHFINKTLVVIGGVLAVPYFPKAALCGAEFPPKGFIRINKLF